MNDNDQIHDTIVGAIMVTWAPVENPERRDAREFAERVAEDAVPALHAVLFKDADAPLTQVDFDLALSLAARIGRTAERRLPLWLRANGHEAGNARYASFTGLDDGGEINLHYSGYERRDDEHYTLPLEILLAPDYEAQAATQIAALEAAAATAKAAKEAKEQMARERHDRATYERLRAHFEEGTPA